MPTIRDIRVIACKPTSENLVIVKIETSEPGLHGLGDATFTQRHQSVVTTIETYLKPLLIGRDCNRISELYRLMHQNGYWRHGPVLNNAIAGIDTALWDIKGKLASMPVYELIGGLYRPAAAVYRHASGDSPEAIVQSVKSFVAQGVRHLRIQLTPRVEPGVGLKASTAGYGGSGFTGNRPDGALDGVYLDPVVYMHEIDAALSHVRATFGQSIELIHDVHSRLMPSDVITLARMLEKHRMFFLEDALAPEQLNWLPRLRAATTTPLAIGELFVHPAEWTGPVSRQELDFIRMHLTSIGGMTPGLRAAHHAAAHDVRTAWHCPKDIAPIGVAMNLALDLAMPNFGVQEFADWSQPEREIFTGLPELKSGYLYPSPAPGWGIEIDETAAARYPAVPEQVLWTQTRAPDGGLIRP
jgi:mannonate dehydratase